MRRGRGIAVIARDLSYEGVRRGPRRCVALAGRRAGARRACSSARGTSRRRRATTTTRVARPPRRPRRRRPPRRPRRPRRRRSTRSRAAHPDRHDHAEWRRPAFASSGVDRDRRRPPVVVPRGLPGRSRAAARAAPVVLGLRRAAAHGNADRERGRRSTRCVAVFGRLYDERFPIRRMQPVDVYGGSDPASMAADNTSAFNCRNAVASGPPRWSAHAYGEAIDVNTIENPYVEGQRRAAARGRGVHRPVERPARHGVRRRRRSSTAFAAVGLAMGRPLVGPRLPALLVHRRLTAAAPVTVTRDGSRRSEPRGNHGCARRASPSVHRRQVRTR